MKLGAALKKAVADGTLTEEEAIAKWKEAVGRYGEGHGKGKLKAPVELRVRGVVREYRLHVPAAKPEGKMPLLVAFHGAGGRDDPFPQQARFHELAEAEGFIIAYPMSKAVPGNEGEWQLNTSARQRQDIDFIEALIDDVSARHPVDPKRVYATGYSLGSMFTYELACHLNSRFAAIASFAGTMPVSPNAFTQEDPVAIMHIHGFKDRIIAYGGEWDWKEWDSVGTMRNIPGLVEYWSRKYNCTKKTETKSASAIHVVHEGGNGAVRVEHYRLNRVGHEWPETINGVSTHRVIWSFLKGFSKPQDTRSGH